MILYMIGGAFIKKFIEAEIEKDRRKKKLRNPTKNRSKNSKNLKNSEIANILRERILLMLIKILFVHISKSGKSLRYPNF